jgi:hypothetical protein
MAITIKDLCELAKVDTEEKENEHIAALLKEPVDRKSTGKALSTLLGYDPTTAFDQLEMSKTLDTFSKEACISFTTDKKNEIIAEAMNSVNKNRDEYQVKALLHAIDTVIDDAEIVNEFDSWSTIHFALDSFEDDDDEDDDDMMHEIIDICNNGFASDDEDDDSIFDDDDD